MRVDVYFPSAGQVQVVSPSVSVDEGSVGSICVVLTATTGSPTELANPLTVNLTSVLNAEAGLLIKNCVKITSKGIG